MLEHFLADLLGKHKEIVGIDERLQKHRESVEIRLNEHDENMQKTLGYARAAIEDDIEEQLIDRKCELDQMVKDERECLEDSIRGQVEEGLADLEQALVERLETAKVVLQFG
jgi:hypothetical protein